MKIKNKKIYKSTFEEFMDKKTPEQRKKYEEGYHEFLLEEMILEAMEKDNILEKINLNNKK